MEARHNLISKKEVTITIVLVNYSRNKAQLIDHYYNKEAINLGLAHGDAGASHKTRVAGSTTAYLPQFRRKCNSYSIYIAIGKQYKLVKDVEQSS